MAAKGTGCQTVARQRPGRLASIYGLECTSGLAGRGCPGGEEKLETTLEKDEIGGRGGEKPFQN